MAGRKAIPPEILAARGAVIRPDRGSGRRPQDLAKVAGVPTECPEWLGAREAEVWHRYADMLAPLGLVTPADGDILGMFAATMVQTIDASVRAREAAGQDGGAALRQFCQALRELRPFVSYFGLSPSERLTKAQGNGDDLDRLLKLEVV